MLRAHERKRGGMEDLNGAVMDAMSYELPEDPFDPSHYFDEAFAGVGY